MKRWYVVALIILLMGALYLFSRPDPVLVTVVGGSSGVVEETVSNTRAGTVKSCQRSKLSLPIGGQINKLYVREGDTVEKGQLLMSLWNDDRAAQVEQAKAQQVSVQKDRESICISANSDAREAKRLTRLVEQNLTSAERADLASARAQSSSAACEAAKAREAQATASLSLAQAILDQTFLHAPFSGKIAEVTGEVGEFSTPSPPGVATPPAVDLLTDDCHYISAPIDEVDASEIVEGMPVRVSMDSFRGREFPATVRRVSTYVLDIEKQARTVEVEASLSNEVGEVSLLAGYSADMEIILKSRKDALRVPSEYIVNDTFVLVVNDGVIKQQEIIKGLSNWHFTEIVAGLSAGDQVISNIGTQGVVVGARAKVKQKP